MYAGIKGRGAEDAWIGTALDIEEAEARGLNCTGGAADIYKCFDQLDREVIYMMAERGGMQLQVLDAYRRFQEGVLVRNAVGDGLGKPYQ